MQKLRKDIFEKKAIFSRLWDCYINADSLVKIPIFPFSLFVVPPSQLHQKRNPVVYSQIRVHRKIFGKTFCGIRIKADRFI